MIFGANSVLFGGYGPETAFKYLAQAGYQGIELSAIQGMCEHLVLDDYKPQVSELKKMAAHHGLEMTAMEVASLDEQRLLRSFEAAAALGIPAVNVGPGGKSGSEDDLKSAIEHLGKMAEAAEDFGVVLCCKAHVGCCIDSTPTTLQAMEAIASPGFGVDMDPSHIFRADENPVEALRAVVSRVKHVHIRDCVARDASPGTPEMQACGRGNIDLHGYIRVLHEAGYDGPVNLEIIGANEYELERCITIAAESRGYLNACRKACNT